jgi:hypothetical protein
VKIEDLASEKDEFLNEPVVEIIGIN